MVKRWMGGVGLVAALVILAACTSGSAESPTHTQSTRTLVPPTDIPSVAPPPRMPPPAATVDDVYAPEPPAAAAQIAEAPATPAQSTEPNPPRAVDSRGLPLGTTCGPAYCTSPDGVIFDNRDAAPGLYDRKLDGGDLDGGDLDGRGFDLCQRTYCAPPGFNIVPGQPFPDTGSSGGY